MVAGVDRLPATVGGCTATGRRPGVGRRFTRESGAEAMSLLLADDPALDAVFGSPRT